MQRKPYTAHQAMFDATVPHGWGYYWKSHYLPPLTDAVIDALAEHAWRKSSGASYTLLFHLGGQIARLPEDHSAAGGRDARHAININPAWTEGGPAHPDIGWCRELFHALDPHSTGGVYVNFVHNDEGQQRVRAAYGVRYGASRASRRATTLATCSAATRTSRRVPPERRPTRWG